jgi:hypothetical protein
LKVLLAVLLTKVLLLKMFLPELLLKMLLAVLSTKARLLLVMVVHQNQCGTSMFLPFALYAIPTLH